jgi:hypothetical protein
MASDVKDLGSAVLGLGLIQTGTMLSGTLTRGGTSRCFSMQTKDLSVGLGDDGKNS